MSKRWYCPNKPEQVHPFQNSEHLFFTRTHRQLVTKTFLENGVQWGLDNPTVLEDEPISDLVCVTCGAVAVEQEVES